MDKHVTREQKIINTLAEGHNLLMQAVFPSFPAKESAKVAAILGGFQGIVEGLVSGNLVIKSRPTDDLTEKASATEDIAFEDINEGESA